MYIISVHELESFSLNIIIYRQIILIFIIFAFFWDFSGQSKAGIPFLIACVLREGQTIKDRNR